MNRVLISAVLAGCFATLTACGSSAPPAGSAEAQAACSATNAQVAAQDAQQAATANSRYATLSVDEAARAAVAAQQVGELSDGSSSDDSGLGALAGANTLGSGGGIKVLEDCVSLGLHVTH